MIEMIKREASDASLIVIDYIQQIGIENIQWLYKAFPESAVLILSQASQKVDEREDHHINLDDIDGIDTFSQYLDTIVSIYRSDYYMFIEEEPDKPDNSMDVQNLRSRYAISLYANGYSLLANCISKGYDEEDE